MEKIIIIKFGFEQGFLFDFFIFIIAIFIFFIFLISANNFNNDKENK
jgi:hypothetical protein